MKKLLLLITLLTSIGSIAQQLSTEIGRVTTRFDYQDSNGLGIENMYSSTDFSYSIGYRTSWSENSTIMVKRFYVNANLTLNNYGAFGSDPIYDNDFSWNVSYLGFGIAADGEIIRRGRVSLLARVMGEPQFLLKGTQKINNDVIDLKGIEQFDKPFFFYGGGIGLTYCLETNSALILRYNIGKGVPMGKGADNEELNFVTNTISLGVLWNLTKCKYCYSRVTR